MLVIGGDTGHLALAPNNPGNHEDKQLFPTVQCVTKLCCSVDIFSLRRIHQDTIPL